MLIRIVLLPLVLATASFANSQIPFVKTLNKSLFNGSDAKPKKDSITRIEIEGLGNISNSQNGTGLSPSANIYVKVMPIQSDVRGRARFYLGFNLGAEQDSTSIDSVKLARLFIPDRGKSGYVARFSYDLFPFIQDWLKNNDNVPVSKYRFTTELNAFVEYNYNKINIKDRIADSAKIELNTWVFGLNFVHSMSTENNAVAFHANPFLKWVTITGGTISTYRSVFSKTLGNAAGEQTVRFVGLDVGLQINRFMFSFVFEDLRTKTFKHTPLYGGVYTLRATVVGDLIRL